MELDLISSNISSLLDVEEDLSEVKILNLHGNELSSLYGLIETSNLIELNLSSNALASCDLPELVYLSSLRVLDLSGNRITTLEGLPFLPSVTSLAVSFNGISSLDGVFNFPNLEEVDCRGNLLSHASDCMHIQPLGKLHSLWLSSSDGRYSNPICSKAGEVVRVFDEARFFGEIDGKDRQRWALDVLSKASFTPKFDLVARKYRPPHDDTASSRMSYEDACFHECDSLSSEVPDSEGLETDGTTGVLKARLCATVLSTLHKQWLRKWFHFWSRTAARLSGHVLERVECAATSTKQLTALEEVLADEKQKNHILEETLVQLKETVDAAEERYAAALQASKRVTESERERSEQLRVQLLKHVAISNTQNAELQKCRHMYATLVEEEKKNATASSKADAEIEMLKKQLEAEELRGEKEREMASLQEKELILRVENLQQEMQLVSEKLQQVEAGSEVQEIEVEALKANLASSQDLCMELRTKLDETEADVERKNGIIGAISEKLEGLRQEFEKEAELSRSSAAKLAQTENIIAQLDGELTESKKFCLEQKASIDDLCAIVVDLKSTLKKNHARCKHVEGQRDKLRGQLDSFSEQQMANSDSWTAEKRSLKQQYNVAMEALQTDLKAMSAKNMTLEKENSRLFTELDATRNNIIVEKSSRGVSVKRVEELQLALRVKEKMLDDQGKLISELRDRLNAESEEARLQVLHVEEMYESAQNEVATIQRQLWASQKMEKELRHLVSDLKGGKGGESDSDDEDHSQNSSAQAGTLNNNNNNKIKAEIEALHQALSLKNKHLESAQHELQELAEALEKLRHKLSIAQKDVTLMREQRDDAVTKAAVCDKTVEELKAEMSSTNDRTKKETADIAAQRDDLLSRLKATEEELNSARESNQKFKDAFAAFSSISAS